MVIVSATQNRFKIVTGNMAIIEFLNIRMPTSTQLVTLIVSGSLIPFLKKANFLVQFPGCLPKIIAF